jgi:peptide/nickel transport system substrate-binding protein
MMSMTTESNEPLAKSTIDRRSFLRGAAVLGAVVAIPGLMTACAPPTTSGGAGTKLLKIGWKSDLDTFNPFTTVTTEAIEILSLMYDNLMHYGVDLKPEPGLAAETKAEGNTITYTLRDGVTWHDGSAFTADDVVFTFDLISKNELGINAQYLTDMTGVTSPDPKTVVVEFSRPQAFDPGLVIPIVPKSIWSAMSTDEITKFANDTPVGTGPFKFGAWNKGQNASITRNDSWWGPKPDAAGVSWTLYTNDDLQAQALKSGEIDVIPQVPPTIFTGLEGAEGIKTLNLDSFSFHHIGINVSADANSKGNPLLLDKSIRQALSCALDRNQIVQIAYAGLAKPGSSLLPPSFGDFHYEPAAADVLDNNPDKANQLLDGAGYSTKNSDGIRQSADGKLLQFRLIAISTTTVDVRTAQLFAESASKVGIKLDVATLDSDTLGSTVYNTDGPDWDLFVWGWDSGVNDPNYLLGVPLSSQIGGNNDVFYADPDYDAMYDKQAGELDTAARVETVLAMQKKFYEDCAYIIPVYLNKLQAYREDSWTGFQETPGGIIFNFTRDNFLNAKASS